MHLAKRLLEHVAQEFGAGQKNRDRQRGDKRAVSHFQIRDGTWGMGVAPYPIALI